MSHPGTLVWFARHESRLAWRDWLAMMTAGRRRRVRTVAIAVICETVVVNWGFVGGSRGIALLQPSAAPLFQSYTRLLFLTMALLAILAVALARYIQTSWIGRLIAAGARTHIGGPQNSVP